MKNYFSAALHSELTPSDCIRAMQADTCDGVLHFPKWDADEDCGEYYVCKVNWNADDAEKVAAQSLPGMQPEKFALCLAVLLEAGLLRSDDGKVYGAVPAMIDGKADLDSTSIMRALTAR